MARLIHNDDSSKNMIFYVVLALALTALVLSLVALFLPFKTSSINGTLDSGQAYHATWKTKAYSSVGGYLMVIASLICVVVSVQLLRARCSLLRASLWALYCSIVAGAIYVVGDTLVVSWRLDIPPEIQHAIGTPYVLLKEIDIINLPALLSMCLVIAYAVVIVTYYAFTALRGKSK